MPDRAAHEAAADRARAAMTLLMSHADDDLLPWVVTTAFYSAVHKAESLFAVDRFAVVRHSSDHIQRNNTIRTKYSALWLHYKPLLDASIVARYCSFNGFDYPKFSDYLTRIAIQQQFIDGYLTNVVAFVDARLRNIS